MNDRDHQNDDELTAGLRDAGLGIVPSSTLEARVRDRLVVRRRRRALQAASAIALVLIGGASAVVLSTSDGPGRVTTAESLPSVDGSVAQTDPGGDATPTLPSTDATLPQTDGPAVNVLVVGTDNGACLEPGSPYAAAFGDRSSMGERSDTIMIMRIDPVNDRASILSFPRDLWVEINGQGAKNRINTAFVRDDPTRLINTLYSAFGLQVDHYLQIDFCGFTTIVDAVGGVSIPFVQPARDMQTGLFVPEPGCHTFDGDAALAYVRSRHYETQDASGVWSKDPAGDLSRIARQQDFLQRTLAAVLERGLTDPDIVRSVIEAARDHVVVDTGLTISRMLELAGELRATDASTIGRYQIEATPMNIAGNSVLRPELDTASMRQVLALFRDEGDDAPGDWADTSTEAATTGLPVAIDPPPSTLSC